MVENNVTNRNIGLYSKKLFIWSLILFAISFIIGFIPLVCSTIAYHLEYSNQDTLNLKARKLYPVTLILLVLGYCVLLISLFIAYKRFIFS